MSVIQCDRCKCKKEYHHDYLFNDGFFFGDNGDRNIFQADEVVCVTCIEKEDVHEIIQT